MDRVKHWSDFTEDELVRLGRAVTSMPSFDEAHPDNASDQSRYWGWVECLETIFQVAGVTSAANRPEPPAR